MTFTYKLAKRLAGLPAAGFLAAAWLMSCTPDDQNQLLDPSQAEPAAIRYPFGRVRITPDSVTLEAGQRTRFAAYRIMRGDTSRTRVEWSASGGTITPDGMFSAGTPGKFKVIGRIGRYRWYTDTDTSVVVVVPPAANLVRVVISPDTATVSPGQTRTFTAQGKLSDSSLTSIGVTWSATGGTMDGAGVYTAGTTPGAYRVIAQNTAGDRADTAAVTIPSATPAPPSLASVVLVPASVTLAPGGTRQFAAYGKLSNGDSVAQAVTWAATGGSISSTGLYSAGQVTGAFRVTATAQGKADSSTATITAAPAPPAPPSPPTAVSCSFYVGPNGSASNPGTEAAPWSMGYLLWDNAGGRARGGNTVCVRGGTYSTALVNEIGENGRTSLTGSAGAPLIIRAYPGERVTLDGGLTINGADTWWWGFDFTYSGWTTRTSPEAGSWPKAIRGPLTSLTVHGARVKMINNVVHDLGGGLESWESATDAELYGNLIYYTGWTGPDRGHGHATYTQSTTGLRKIRDNLSWDSFGNGNIAYGSDAVQLKNVELTGNSAWNHGSLGREGANQFVLGAGGSTENITFTDNVVYDGYGGASTVRFGYDPNAVNRNFVIRNNYLIGGEPALRIWNLTQSTFTGNTFYTPETCGGCRVDLQRNTAGYTWSGNTWHGSTAADGWGYNNAGYTAAGWKSATGLGNSDTFIGSAPSGLKIVVRANAYEPGRANVTVVNWTGASAATIDLSGIGLKPGQPYEVRNAQNFFGPPVATGSGPGGVTVPLAGLSKAAVRGSVSEQPTNTGTHFNAFVVVPK